LAGAPGTAHRARVLVVDDEESITDVISVLLRHLEFDVETAATGREALDRADSNPPDLIVLDVMLPDIDGFEVCRRMRAGGVEAPVIFLTALDKVTDKVTGLELGGDDYLTKPFSPAELVARVKAVLRRVDGGPAAEVMQCGEVAIDAGRREVRVAGDAVEFTTKEFDLLRYLAERPGLALSRQQILDGVWGYDWYGDARTVDVHIAQVRKKLGDAVEITTVRGVGYRLES
jgi:DNA-binding response OmpR family regulator